MFSDTNKKTKVKKVRIVEQNNANENKIKNDQSPKFKKTLAFTKSPIPNEILNKKNRNTNNNLKKLNLTNYRNKSQNNLFQNNTNKYMNMTVLPPIREKVNLINRGNPSSLKLNKKAMINYKDINSFERMKKYKIIFKKNLKKNEPRKEDKLFKFLRENGLHYSLSANKYVLNESDSDFIAHKNKYRNRYIVVEKDDSKIESPLPVKNNEEKEERQNHNSNKKPTNKEKQPLYFYSTTEQDDEDKMSYKKYMKMQQIAEMKLKPKYGDFTNDLINYVKKIENIRKGVVKNLVEDIENKVENRYNSERPKEDSKIDTKEQELVHHKWKNLFSLRDYQELFINSLQGKISEKSYSAMMKNFKEISLICFADGNLNFNKLRAEL